MTKIDGLIKVSGLMRRLFALLFLLSFFLLLPHDVLAATFVFPTRPPLPTRIQVKATSTPKLTTTPKPTRTPTPTERPSQTPTPTEKLQPTPDSDKRDFMMKQINDYRALNKLSPVQTDPYTCDFAQVRAKELTTPLSHDGFNNRKDNHTLPYPNYSLITENLARTTDYKRVVNLWINSPGHAANMRKDTQYVCVAWSGDYYAYEGWQPL